MSFGGFGVSVGDAFAVGTFAWKVYKICKTAPKEFQEVTAEVASLHTALNELSDEQRHADSSLNKASGDKKASLGKLLEHCHTLLAELDELLSKRKSLGTDNRKSWDRIRFGASDIESFRVKLLSHTNSISIFLAGLGTRRLSRIEGRLDQLAHEIRLGSRESTIFVFGDTDEPIDARWEQLGNELERVGITKEDIDTHKNGIQAYAQELAERYGLGNPSSSTMTNALCRNSSGSLRSRSSARYPPVSSQKSLRRLASVARLSSAYDGDSDKLEHGPYNEPNRSHLAGTKSVSEVVTDVQEYDEQGRLRRRSITRQSSGSSVGTSASASVNAKPSIFNRHSLNDEYSTDASAATKVERPSSGTLRTQTPITKQAGSPSKISEQTREIRYLDKVLPTLRHAWKGNFLWLRVQPTPENGRDIIQFISERLCISAFEFVANSRMPIFLQSNEKMIQRPEDRTWMQWVQLLIEVILDNRTTIRCESHRTELVTVLHRSSLLEPRVEYPEAEAEDGRKTLQLISAALQVAKVFEDGSAVEDFDQLYKYTEMMISKGKSSELQAPVGKRSCLWSSRLFKPGEKRLRKPVR